MTRKFVNANKVFRERAEKSKQARLRRQRLKNEELEALRAQVKELTRRKK
jgi:hypothetical protein